MKCNISYLEVPLAYQLKKWDDSKLKENMFLTADPLYKSIEIEFEKLIDIIKSDYRQYSPFEFAGKTKKSDNWRNDNQNIIILDIDDGLSIAEAKEMFKNYTYLIATTKSHQQMKKGIKCDRFRVIMPAVKVPVGDEYFEFTRALEKKYPFIDEQVNTKTGAFLGYAECEYWYNYGESFDCGALLGAYRRAQRAIIKEPVQSKTKERNTPTPTTYEEIDIQAIKSRLTREIVADIVRSCGYEVNRKFMFKYRQDERTPSASISPRLLIKDFGGDLSTDVIGFLMEAKGMRFKDAVNTVGEYVGVVAS